MPKCLECNRNTGFGNVTVCEECCFSYQDEVIILNKFYKGLKVRIFEKKTTPGCYDWGALHVYYIVLINGEKKKFFHNELKKCL